MKKKSNLTRFYETHSMQTTRVGGWAVLYFYGEPWVPVLKNINWNGSSSGSTHKWNPEFRFEVQIFPPKKEKKMVLVLVLKIRPASSLVLDNLDWNWRLISSFYYYQEILVKRFSPNYYDTPGQLPHWLQYFQKCWNFSNIYISK